MTTVIALVMTFAVISRVSVQAQSENVSFPVGPGFTDVIPHQIVRTDDDRVYIIAAVGQYKTEIAIYWTGTPGLPQAGDFDQLQMINIKAEPISVDAVYDGADIIHILVNTRAPALYDYALNIRTNTVQPPITVPAHPATIEGVYMGTSGLSGMFDAEGMLHIAYWSNDDHIMYQPFRYDVAQNTLTEAEPATQVDSAGSANHPVLAVSPVTQAVTIAWVSEYENPAAIRARTRSESGEWGKEERVSTAPVWTSTSAGINIDQGPSLVIDHEDTQHLVYIEDYGSDGEYGHVHYVYKASTDSKWADVPLAMYSHDPAVALNDRGGVFIVGHGAEATGENVNMYVSRKQQDGLWSELELIATPQPGDSLDSSVSVKWSVVGWNRPDLVEFVFFAAHQGDYDNATLYYGRLGE
ncbi:MAG: hypothetical protein R3E39_28475 [Anaerolineae bacterium]